MSDGRFGTMTIAILDADLCDRMGGCKDMENRVTTMTKPLTPEERAEKCFRESEHTLGVFETTKIITAHIAAAVEEAKREERERIVESLKRYAREHFPTGAIRDFSIASRMIDIVAKENP